MGNISGPFTEQDFRFMQDRKQSIAFMKADGYVPFVEAIRKETILLNERMRRTPDAA